jgi:hypothetical protein
MAGPSVEAWDAESVLEWDAAWVVESVLEWEVV